MFKYCRSYILCEIFGSIRENSGNLTIQDLIDRIDGAKLIDEESVNALEQYNNAVILFMGAVIFKNSTRIHGKCWCNYLILICLC